MNSLEIPAQVIDNEMRQNFIKNANEKPWGWEWKYTMAFKMLQEGRPIDHVKKVLRLTLRWMQNKGLIEFRPDLGMYKAVVA